MKTVYKYEIHYEEANIATFDIPQGAKLLSLQVQAGKPVLYFEVESRNPTRRQDFLLVETGATIPPGVRLKYIGTVVLRDDSYVIHVYWYAKLGAVI